MSALPIPPHFDSLQVGNVWRVPYQERAGQARDWAAEHAIRPAAGDTFRVGLLLVDVQNTFCIPGYELFVGGRNGTGAVEDNARLCQFIYRNLAHISEISITMDTHRAIQIFHAIFLIDESGAHPAPNTQVSLADVEDGRWRINPALLGYLRMNEEDAHRELLHYTRSLKESGKYDLTIWPYHAMLGGVGHALVSSVEEAVFFHTLARYAHPDFIVKGDHTLTEHYSVIGPEVCTDVFGRQIAHKSNRIIQKLLDLDALFIAGQAKSHCVAWTVADLLEDIRERDSSLARKVYLLEDCTSSVVIPGVVDFTDAADQAYRTFAEAGMHVIRSADWPF